MGRNINLGRRGIILLGGIVRIAKESFMTPSSTLGRNCPDRNWQKPTTTQAKQICAFALVLLSPSNLHLWSLFKQSRKVDLERFVL